MNKIINIFTLFILSLTTLTFADQAEQVITLKDGSQIKGELAGIDNGIYTVKTPIIGDVHVAASDVASITNNNGTAASLPTNNVSPTSQSLGSVPNMDAQIAARQQALVSNPQSMAILKEMSQDPEIMQALQDPDVLQAVTTHDYQAIQNNPRIKELMSSPKMQALLQQLASQQQQQSPSSQQ